MEAKSRKNMVEWPKDEACRRLGHTLTLDTSADSASPVEDVGDISTRSTSFANVMLGQSTSMPLHMKEDRSRKDESDRRRLIRELHRITTSPSRLLERRKLGLEAMWPEVSRYNSKQV
ncbi:MAG: hypothetical protein M1828_001051 [Chrysothrix sp. TS-e1954]|nr:MAG: hypothetical protein M1828_001051 [Chrysothrix sp. TS-e1954]